jgi:hypothetical protein
MVPKVVLLYFHPLLLLVAGTAVLQLLAVLVAQGAVLVGIHLAYLEAQEQAVKVTMEVITDLGARHKTPVVVVVVLAQQEQAALVMALLAEQEVLELHHLFLVLRLPMRVAVVALVTLVLVVLEVQVVGVLVVVT